MSRKVILCRCEDVTLADVQHAVALGYADIEEVKRYTGFGTGPCQGKECLVAVATAVAAAAAARAGGAAPFTSRPPLVPTELGVLAGQRHGDDARRGRARTRTADGEAAPVIDDADDGDRRRRRDGAGDRLQPGGARRQAHRRRRRPLPGRGRVGAQRRRRAPAVVDRDERPADAGVDRDLPPSPRRWASTSGCARAATCSWRAARRPSAGCEKNVALQNDCGVPTRMIAPAEAQGLVPELDARPVRRRLLQPDRRHRVPVAVPVGLRARGGCARGRHPHVDAGHGHRAARARRVRR